MEEGVNFKGNLGGWGNWFRPWVSWWLHNSMQLSKPTGLYHKKFFFLTICTFYLGKVWDLCRPVMSCEVRGPQLSLQVPSIFLLVCSLERLFIHNLFLTKRKSYFSLYLWLDWFLSLGTRLSLGQFHLSCMALYTNSPVRSIELSPISWLSNWVPCLLQRTCLFSHK